MAKELISNVKVYDLEESVMASGYPMRAEISDYPASERDYARADRLADNPAGSGHNNFLSGILVSFDLSATIKMWTEIERYHFLQIVSSQSTMHKLRDMDIDAASIGYVASGIVMVMRSLQLKYMESGKQEDFLRLVYSCPVGLKLTARVSTNYLQLKTIYAQRKDHRLPEWKDFCQWIETLPRSEWITGKKAGHE